jgi:hypothetical protein
LVELVLGRHQWSLRAMQAIVEAISAAPLLIITAIA